MPALRPVLLLLAVALTSCATTPRRRSAPPDTVARVLALAQEYADGYYAQFPEESHLFGYPDPHPDRLSDLSPEGLRRWQAREDAWLAELKAIPPAALEGTPAAIPYASITAIG